VIEPVLDGNEQLARLAVGDRVVYASHGIGRVAARGAAAGGGETVVLELPDGLSVTLPIALARTTLRPLSTELDVARVRRTLRDPETPTQGVWAARFKATREKVTVGGVVALAEVVRDGVHREQRTAERGTSPASPTERLLYRKARRLLADEIAAARGIEPAAADAWIVDQVRAALVTE